MTIRGDEHLATQRFTEFTRAEWAALRAATPLPLSEPQLKGLAGLNEPMSLDEVTAIYLPLARLLNLYIEASQALSRATATFLGSRPPSRAVRDRARRQRGRGQEHRGARPAGAAGAMAQPSAGDLVTTDGFLLPLRVLEARGLVDRKGFPGELRPASAWCSSWPT